MHDTYSGESLQLKINDIILKALLVSCKKSLLNFAGAYNKIVEISEHFCYCGKDLFLF